MTREELIDKYLWMPANQFERAKQQLQEIENYVEEEWDALLVAEDYRDGRQLEH